MKKNSIGFSLVEILVGILIFSIVMVGAFYSFAAISHGKIKLIEETNLEKEAYYFSEILFEFVKKGGLIDYEEYFNNSFVQFPPDTPIATPSAFQNGHYRADTRFGNGRNLIYYCLSNNVTGKFYDSNGTGTGCLHAYNTNRLTTGGTTIDLTTLATTSRRLAYGQYGYQFLDLNSDADNDGGDEDGNTRIIRDNDDSYVGGGPVAFSGSQVHEVYLISGDGKKRTLLRWNVGLDPNRPTGSTCLNYSAGDPSTISGDGCFGEVEYLKLEGVDWGNDHNNTTQDTNGSQLDGKIDTWIYDKNVYGLTTDIVAMNSVANQVYRTSLFPDTMSVKNIEFYLAPNKDSSFAWRENSPQVHIQPYMRVKITLTPSWKKRKGMKGVVPEFTYTSTISLTDIFSR